MIKIRKLNPFLLMEKLLDYKFGILLDKIDFELLLVVIIEALMEYL